MSDEIPKDGLTDAVLMEREFNDHDRRFIEGLIKRLSADPRLAEPVLQAVADNNAEFIKRTEAHRNSEASQVILDLIGVVMDPKGFTKLTPAMQRSLMHRVIAYHFFDAKEKSHFYAPCELAFFKKFGEKK